LILRSVRALVGPRLESLIPAAIAIEGTRIVEVSNEIAGETMDLGDLTLLPGFIDAHVHIGLADPAAVVHGGVTTVRDLAWPLPEIQRLEAGSRERDYIGPQVVAAGAMLTVPDGYPTRAAWAPAGTGRVVEGPGAAEAAVAEQADAGACIIKVALNAAVGPTFDPDTLRAVCDAAHERGLRVTAHIFGLAELVKALEAEVDEMAHVLLSPDSIPDEVTARMVAQGMAVVPTLSITRGRLTRMSLLNLAAFVEAGGRVVYGTDLGNRGPKPGIDRKEVIRMMRSGMSSPSIVAAGTTGAASWLGLETKGVIAPGMDADLIAVAGDPMDVAAALTDVRFVMREGRVLREPVR
jgi:imidazolonepropionase-like amidohydrolase